MRLLLGFAGSRLLCRLLGRSCSTHQAHAGGVEAAVAAATEDEVAATEAELLVVGSAVGLAVVARARVLREAGAVVLSVVGMVVARAVATEAAVTAAVTVAVAVTMAMASPPMMMWHAMQRLSKCCRAQVPRTCHWRRMLMHLQNRWLTMRLNRARCSRVLSRLTRRSPSGATAA